VKILHSHYKAKRAQKDSTILTKWALFVIYCFSFARLGEKVRAFSQKTAIFYNLAQKCARCLYKNEKMRAIMGATK
jgi:hypothetical protein